MNKFTSLLIGVSLALAGVAFAQPTAEESPAAGGKKQGKQKSEQTEGPKAQGPMGEQGAGKGHKGKGANANATGAEMNTSSQATGSATAEPGMGRGKGKGRGAKAEASVTGTGTEAGTGAAATTETGATGGKKGKQGRNATTNTAAETGASAEAGASASVPPVGGKHAGHEKGMKGGANAKASAAPSASMAPVGATGATGSTGANATTANAGATTTQGTVGKGGKKVEKQQIQQIKQQHASFKAQPKPNVAPTVTFNQNYHISGAEQWQGPRYEVFRSYHPEWHDHGWYHSHYGQVVLIAGGWYFLNNGYWYPAWGYDQNASYYAYDGPIYVGHRAEPPDRVIADVQAVLQDMGYYTGEVDGLLGPLTRQALRDYQADHGLMVTEAIDEPTLDALELS